MRIVMVQPACPNRFGDTAARWSYVAIRQLLALGHHVGAIVVTGESDRRIRDSRELLGSLEGSARLSLEILPMARSEPWPLRKWRSARKPLSELLYAPGSVAALRSQLSRGCDVLHLEQLWSGWLAEAWPRTLLNVHHFEVIDREGENWAGWSHAKSTWQMRRATTAILRRARAVRVFTPRLQEFAQRINPDAAYWVLPFAIDTALYPMVEMCREPIVGIIGSMHWEPSRSAAERLADRVWPLVRRAVPGAKLVVAGWNADVHLKRLAGQPGLELRPNVGHPRDFFSSVSVMAYPPRRGSGMKIKVLEAMAYGVPVVTTSEGIEGLNATAGHECCVSDDDDRLADHIIRLLRDPRARGRMREAGRALVERSYSPAPVVSRLTTIYEQVCEAS